MKIIAQDWARQPDGNWLFRLMGRVGLEIKAVVIDSDCTDEKMPPELVEVCEQDAYEALRQAFR